MYDERYYVFNNWIKYLVHSTIHPVLDLSNNISNILIDAVNKYMTILYQQYPTDIIKGITITQTIIIQIENHKKHKRNQA